MSYYEDAEDRHSRRSGTSKTRDLSADFVCHIGKKKPRASEETRG